MTRGQSGAHILMREQYMYYVTPYKTRCVWFYISYYTCIILCTATHLLTSDAICTSMMSQVRRPALRLNSVCVCVCMCVCSLNKRVSDPFKDIIFLGKGKNMTSFDERPHSVKRLSTFLLA